MKNELVSIVVRTKDRIKKFRQAVESVYFQTYRPIQLIVINDGGEDVAPVLNDFSENEGITIDYFSNEESTGRVLAANKGLSLVRGSYVMFLDDDDWLSENHLQNLVNILKNDKKAILSYTGCLAVDENGTIIKKYADIKDKKSILIENFIPINSYLFKSKALKECSFDTQFDIYEDWDFLLQLYFLGDFVNAKGETAYYRIEYGGSSDVHNPEISRIYRQKIYSKWFDYLSSKEVMFLADEALKAWKLSYLEEEIKEINKFLVNKFAKATKNNLSKFDLLEYTNNDLFLQMFINSGNGFDEKQSYRLNVNNNDELQKFDFDLSGFDKVVSLRLDPLNIPTVCQLINLTIKVNGNSYNLIEKEVYNNSCYREKLNFYFESEDSSIIFEDFNLPDSYEKKLILEIRYTHFGNEALKVVSNKMREAYEKSKNKYESQSEQIDVLQDEIKNRGLVIDSLNKDAEYLNNEYNNLNNKYNNLSHEYQVLNSNHEELKKDFLAQKEHGSQLKSELEHLHNVVINKEYEYYCLVNSRSWKLLSPFRYCSNYFRKIKKR